jgi:type I restriction enzyme S subunit
MKNLSEFLETTLGGIARKDKHGLVDGPFGSNLPASEYTSSGIPVIRGSNLSLGQERFRAKDYVFVSEQIANRIRRSLCHPDDIIFTKKGTLGQTGIVPRTEIYKTFLLSSNQMKLSVDTEIADPLFVYYYVSSPISRERILREAMTTGVPKINLEYLRKFSISLPPSPHPAQNCCDSLSV